MIFKRFALVACLLAITTVGLALPSSAGDGVSITLVTHDSFNVTKSVLRSFERKTGIDVRILRAGDAGQALNQAILTKDNPIGDVLYGVDNTFLSRALGNGIFERYSSPELAHVPSSYVLDRKHRVTPIDRSDVCINFDKQWYADRDAEVPGGIDALTDAKHSGELVVENPATSSPGLAFLLATIAAYGEDGWQSYWQELRANDVEVVDGWEQAWYERFTAGGGENGDKPLVVSYASSPPATVPEDGGPARAGTLLDSCFEQIELAGVLKGTEHRAEARQLIDFLLSQKFQADMPEQMYVFPVHDAVPLPPSFAQWAELPETALSLAPAKIQRNREEWIRQWTEIVLR